MTITTRPFIAAGAALAAAAVLAACGGSDNSSTQGTAGASVPATTTTSTSTSTQATTDTTTTEKTTTTSTTQANAEGKTVFTENCASCHTLKAADASGQVGPNLDDLQPDAATVQKQVENGGGPMPAFKGQLTPAQISAVAAFVSSSAGKG